MLPEVVANLSAYVLLVFTACKLSVRLPYLRRVVTLTDLLGRKSMTHIDARLVSQRAARSSRSIYRRLLVNWHSRRRLAKLKKLNDQLLHDIGLKREDLQWALNRPSAGGSDDLRRILLRRTD